MRTRASEVQRLADEVRRAAGALRQCEGVDFQSRAADRYRHDLREQARRADGTVNELMEASRALHRHADEVERRLRQLAALEGWFRDRVRDARSVLGQVAQAGDTAGDAARREAAELVNAARRAPAPGSPEWERFAARFR